MARGVLSWRGVRSGSPSAGVLSTTHAASRKRARAFELGRVVHIFLISFFFFSFSLLVFLLRADLRGDF